MKKVLCVLVIMGVITVIHSCSKTEGNDNPTPTPSACDNISKTWSTDVSPLISSFCNQPGCHNTGSSSGPGALTTHAQVFDARNQVRDAVQSGRMPQNTTLSADQKNKIVCWINSGAPNN